MSKCGGRSKSCDRVERWGEKGDEEIDQSVIAKEESSKSQWVELNEKTEKKAQTARVRILAL
jgi:hypothetical protein